LPAVTSSPGSTGAVTERQWGTVSYVHLQGVGDVGPPQKKPMWAGMRFYSGPGLPTAINVSHSCTPNFPRLFLAGAAEGAADPFSILLAFLMTFRSPPVLKRQSSPRQEQTSTTSSPGGRERPLVFVRQNFVSAGGVSATRKKHAENEMRDVSIRGDWDMSTGRHRSRLSAQGSARRMPTAFARLHAPACPGPKG